MAPKKKPTDELKDQRIPIMMTEAELKAIDDWRFGNRIASRGEAIRRLCQIGMFASETSEDLWRAIRTITDAKDVALLQLSDADLTAEKRREIRESVWSMPESPIMIVKALALWRTVEAFRSKSDFDDAVALGKQSEREMRIELDAFLSETRDED